MAPPTSAERTSEDSSSPTQPFLEQRIPFREEFLRPPRSSLSWFIHILAFCVSLTLGLVALTMKPSALQCTHQLSPYSPLIEEGLIKYESKNFDNEFDKPSNYRGQPSNLTEASWKALWENHCIELLRITLMCTSDVTPLLFIDDPHAFQGRTPDFNTMHTCRNFWEIREWVERMGLPPLS
ncbi:hypothetical protein BDV34DRAFT_217609 [Aspergillus parasiticus]|uniref:Uncharacterized protein n=1 Tax=Aspergillus parasiticus TaxID=5067 RepID=A0A5N6D7A0_ASPPA|nr:hypothetical protein BDV34DRAFT_217609 [Aspergillus parasiticus]